MAILIVTCLAAILAFVGAILLLSDSNRYDPNDWRGLLHSRRFWSGLALFLVGIAMIFSPVGLFRGLL